MAWGFAGELSLFAAPLGERLVHGPVRLPKMVGHIFAQHSMRGFSGLQAGQSAARASRSAKIFPWAFHRPIPGESGAAMAHELGVALAGSAKLCGINAQCILFI